ncbi:MAG: hypothetical protein WKF84_20695 [Pyrinomonadaceae bacterium]
MPAQVTVACAVKPEAAWLPHPRVNWLYAPVWRGSVSARLLRTNGVFCGDHQRVDDVHPVYFASTFG